MGELAFEEFSKRKKRALRAQPRGQVGGLVCGSVANFEQSHDRVTLSTIPTTTEVSITRRGDNAPSTCLTLANTATSRRICAQKLCDTMRSLLHKPCNDVQPLTTRGGSVIETAPPVATQLRLDLHS